MASSDDKHAHGEATKACTRVASFTLGDRQLAVLELDSERDVANALAGMPFDELARFQVGGGSHALVVHAREMPQRASRAANVLSGRELQIANLVAEGMLNKEIADRLRISEWTVCAHLRRVFAKLGVSNRASM